MSRSLGWTLLTTRSPIEIVPEVMFSSPASIRSRVDLPQPDGPTRTTKAPSSIGIDTPCRTSKPPNDFRTSRICTDDIHTLPVHVILAANSAVVRLFDRGLTRLFRRCRWIKVVGRAPPRQTLRTGRRHANISHPFKKLRTKIRRVRCGRNHEQALYRRHQTQ